MISEIDFQASAREGDLIEMGLIATQFGRTSLTMKARVRNMITRKTILNIEKIVFVGVDEAGTPVRRFLPDLIELIWNREIDLGKVVDQTMSLNDAAAAYSAMDSREAVKVLLRP